jgi:hypothetical protein
LGDADVRVGQQRLGGLDVVGELADDLRGCRRAGRRGPLGCASGSDYARIPPTLRGRKAKRLIVFGSVVGCCGVVFVPG